MNKQITLISDASCDPYLSIAVAVVYDVNEDKFHTKVFYRCGTSYKAEKLSLEFAIKIAHKKAYTNVIFKFDAITLFPHFKNYSKELPDIDYHFEWVGRKGVKKADKEANIVLRRVRESLYKKMEKHSLTLKEAKKLAIKKRMKSWKK
jgi:hypothetical protein